MYLELSKFEFKSYKIRLKNNVLRQERAVLFYYYVQSFVTGIFNRIIVKLTVARLIKSSVPYG